MILKGKLYTESPIYRGNARKTLFTRDGDGTHRLISLPGEISGTAQSLMDAFIGQSKNKKNIGLINQLWKRLYGTAMPDNLIDKIDCKLQKNSYPQNNFFDLRMGIRLDEDRWAAEANANYKMETVMRHCVFDMVFSIKDNILKKNDNEAKLYYVLREIQAGRFWFGAGKSKGLGRVRLEAKLPFSAPDTLPDVCPGTNHLAIHLDINTQNPMLVGWNWGKVDPHTPSFAAIEGRLLIQAMKNIPEPVRKRLEMALGGVILNPEDWKGKFAEYLPRIISIWLRDQSVGEKEFYVLPGTAISKLSKGKHALTKKVLANIEPLAGKPFQTLDAAEEVFKQALGKKANMAKRIMDLTEHTRETRQELDMAAWLDIADNLGLDKSIADSLAPAIDDEDAMIKVLAPACQSVLPALYQQVDQQIKLIQSDAWVDAEIASREEHLYIKKLLKDGKITEYQWNDPGMPPEGIRSATWREFLDAHRRVQLRHMLNPANLKKSIANDRNHIEFLKSYRDQTRQELAQPYHIDFRARGQGNREISRKYGKPYDTIFMRMLTWRQSAAEKGTWEIYIPGSTLKGAFRKRASQMLKTLWGESRKTTWILNRLFGAQGQRGLVFFSDAYLTDPENTGRTWCSMDGIRMDPRTGQPIETSKRDYLFAYGDQLRFHCCMDIQDIGEKDMEAVSLLCYLLRDFQNGDIPVGGEKTTGFGWTKAEIARLTWRTADTGGIGAKLFDAKSFKPEGIWQTLELTGDAAAEALQPLQTFSAEEKIADPPLARDGFISHRAFGGYCGMLEIEAEVLTPVNIQESGEPSFTTVIDGEPVNGWDFFSMGSPVAEQRGHDREYALPSRSLKGMLRHLYTIVTDSRTESPDLSRLNPADSLFGWVGDRPNQALTGRLSFSFGIFDKPGLAWFRIPYPYGDWQYTGGKWKHTPQASASKKLIANHWRIFPHAPLAPIAEQIEDFIPDTVQARYVRAILPGSRARFSIRFWNLLEEELQKLLWCVALEPELAHKIGNNRYLGFGSLRLKILDTSYLIDLARQYSGESEAKQRKPLKADKFINTKDIRHYQELKKGLVHS